MAELRAASEGGTEFSNFGAAGTGAGADVLAELERVRANLLALAERFEELRATFNAHSHNGAVAAPPAGEQAGTAFTVQ